MSETLTVQLRDNLTSSENISLGFRAEMLRIGEGKVLTGTGLGTDSIILTWGERSALIRGRDLLRAWVETFAPNDATRFPNDDKR